LAAEVGFPLLGKPSEQSGGSRNVAILADESEIEQYGNQVGSETNVLVQEYVESPDTEYTVGVMVSKCGELIDSIAIRRNLIGMSLGAARQVDGHTYKVSTGFSQGFVVRHSAVQKACESLALKIGIRGPANIQCRVSGDDVIIFEVHPRFSGTTSIRAEVGFNEPDILIRNFLSGDTFGRLDYQTNVAAIRALRSLIVPVSAMRRIPRV
jgi:carbamoyl-phosphate synthase large subunit